MSLADRVRTGVRDRVPLTATLLSALSLTLVFAAALRAIPAGPLPRAPTAVLEAIPPVNAGLSLLALGAIFVGVRAIRRGRVRRHRAAMLTALGLFATFLVLYLYRIVLVGPTPFPGEGFVETLYLAILGIHITLAVVCIPLLYYVALLALTRPVAEIPGSRHPTVGRVAAALWATSFALGIVVYLLLYVVY